METVAGHLTGFRHFWWPQRDETPNGIPAEFVIKL
jgi:hypothetical protein